MRFLRPSSAVLLAAGILALAAAAQAQTRAASGDDGVKAAKRAQNSAPRSAATPRPDDKEHAEDEGDESDMIMLREPFRSGPATPVSITHGK